jgi:hypothetical protein
MRTANIICHGMFNVANHERQRTGTTWHLIFAVMGFFKLVKFTEE